MPAFRSGGRRIGLRRSASSSSGRSPDRWPVGVVSAVVGAGSPVVRRPYRPRCGVILDGVGEVLHVVERALERDRDRRPVRVRRAVPSVTPGTPPVAVPESVLDEVVGPAVSVVPAGRPAGRAVLPADAEVRRRRVARRRPRLPRPAGPRASVGRGVGTRDLRATRNPRTAKAAAAAIQPERRQPASPTDTYRSSPIITLLGV